MKTYQTEIVFERFEALKGPEYKIAFDNFQVKKVNRTSYVLNGEISLNVDLNNGNDLLVTTFNFKANTYKKTAERTFFGWCNVTFDESMRSMWETIEKSSNVKKFGTCPYPAVRMISFHISFFI